MVQLVRGRTNSASPRLSCLKENIVADGAEEVILCTDDLITNNRVDIYCNVEGVAATVVVVATANNIQLGICQFAYIAHIAHNFTPYLDYESLATPHHFHAMVVSEAFSRARLANPQKITASSAYSTSRSTCSPT